MRLPLLYLGRRLRSGCRYRASLQDEDQVQRHTPPSALLLDHEVCSKNASLAACFVSVLQKENESVGGLLSLSRRLDGGATGRRHPGEIASVYDACIRAALRRALQLSAS